MRGAVLRGAALCLLSAGAAGGWTEGRAAGADPSALPAAIPAARPATARPSEAFVYALPSRAVAVQAGMGVLLRLPEAAGTILSAEPAIARVQPVSPTTLFVMGVAPGRTNVIAATDDGEPIGQFDIVVSPPVAAPSPPAVPRPVLPTEAMAREVGQVVHRRVPGAGSVTAHAAGSRLILGGSVRTAAVARQVEAVARSLVGREAAIVDGMTVLDELEVRVRIRVAEISRTATSRLGFAWQPFGADAWRVGVSTGVAGGIGLGVSFLNGPPPDGATPVPVDARPSPSLATFLPGAVRSRSSGPGRERDGLDVNGMIDGLAAERRAVVLAEPDLIARSGEPTSFRIGGEVPVAADLPAASLAFRSFGVGLALVPTVLSPTRLALRVRPEASPWPGGAVRVAAGQGGGQGTAVVSVPAVRRAETEVELDSGQSLAIAGLLRRDAADAAAPAPGMGDLPVIGALLRSPAFQRGESELVIVVTPYLAPAGASRAAPVPAGVDPVRAPPGGTIAPRFAGASLNAGFILK